MGSPDNASVEQVTEQLADRLVAIRREQAEAPEEERRQSFGQALGEGLQGLDEASASRVLDGIRERLIAEARDRERQVGELQARVQELTVERDRLREENEQLGQAAPAEPAETPQAGPAARGDALARVREGLQQIAAGKKVTAESIGLPEEEARFFRLVQELLRFAQDYEMGLNFLLAEFRIGPSKDMDTQMMRHMKQLVRRRFRDCLEGKEGSVQALQDTLSRNARFLIDLNNAYSTSLQEGTRTMLAELDPMPILEANKRMIGHNFEEAWRQISQKQADLANLSKDEMSERFFFEPFQSKLADYLGKGN
jgi:hypothetical protein